MHSIASKSICRASGLSDVRNGNLLLSNLTDYVPCSILMCFRATSTMPVTPIEDYSIPIVDVLGSEVSYIANNSSFNQRMLVTNYSGYRRRRSDPYVLTHSFMFGAKVMREYCVGESLILYSLVVKSEDSIGFHYNYRQNCSIDWSKVELWYDRSSILLHSSEKEFFYNTVLPMAETLGIIAYSKTPAEMKKLEFVGDEVKFNTLSNMKKFGEKELADTIALLRKSIVGYSTPEPTDFTFEGPAVSSVTATVSGIANNITTQWIPASQFSEGQVYTNTETVTDSIQIPLVP